MASFFKHGSRNDPVFRLLRDYVYPNIYDMIGNVSRSVIGAAYR